MERDNEIIKIKNVNRLIYAHLMSAYEHESSVPAIIINSPSC